MCSSGDGSLGRLPTSGNLESRQGSSGIQQPQQHRRLAQIDLFGGGEQRQSAWRGQGREVPQSLGTVTFLELTAVAPLESSELRGVVAVPRPKLGGRRNITTPLVECRSLPGDPTWPTAV